MHRVKSKKTLYHPRFHSGSQRVNISLFNFPQFVHVIWENLSILELALSELKGVKGIGKPTYSVLSTSMCKEYTKLLIMNLLGLFESEYKP